MSIDRIGTNNSSPKWAPVWMSLLRILSSSSHISSDSHQLLSNNIIKACIMTHQFVLWMSLNSRIIKTTLFGIPAMIILFLANIQAHFQYIFSFWFRLLNYCHVFLCRLCNRNHPALHHWHPRHHLLLLPLQKTGLHISELNPNRRNERIHMFSNSYHQEAKNPVFEFITLVTLVFSLVSIKFWKSVCAFATLIWCQ